MAENENSEVLVSCKGISKKFCRNLKKSLWYGVKDGVSEIITGQSSDELRKDEFWALKDVSFELRRGECLGLLGRNGAGKTTLLKVLSGLIKPDQGTVSLKGRIGGLIALGAGFNGILSGRENIRINGSILGYSREEIEERMQEIIDFAEIPDFIDAPVNTYSSGMSVRLGFAIAAILTKPDVLLLDEVLAVGDIGFTIKCLNAVRDMMKDSAVIFVSHNIQFVSRFCTLALLMERGKKLSLHKDIKEATSRYLSQFQSDIIESGEENISIIKSRMSPHILSNKRIIINCNSEIFLNLLIKSKNIFKKVEVSVVITKEDSTPVITFKDIPIFQLNTKSNLTLNLGILPLTSGNYNYNIAFSDHNSKIILKRYQSILPFTMESSSSEWAHIVLPIKQLTV